MLQQILHVTGIEQKLANLKDQLTTTADAVVDRVKGAAIKVAIAASLAVVGIIFAILSLIAGLVALFAWLQPEIGTLPALGVLAGSLLVLALVFAGIAVGIGKSIGSGVVSNAVEEGQQEAKRIVESAPTAGPRPADPALAARAARAAEEDLVARTSSLYSLVRPFARLPKTGIDPIDNLLREVEPKAAEWAKDTVARGAELVRTGSLPTMVSVLAAAAAVGWAIAKTSRRAIVIDGKAQ